MGTALPLITKNNLFRGIRLKCSGKYVYLVLAYDYNQRDIINIHERIYNETNLKNKLNEFIEELYLTKTILPENIEDIDKIKINYIMQWRKWHGH